MTFSRIEAPNVDQIGEDVFLGVFQIACIACIHVGG